MRKFIVSFLLMTISQLAYAGLSFHVGNSELVPQSNTSGNIIKTGIDPFNPADHCATFVSPNTCLVNGDHIEWNMVYEYELVLTEPGTVSVEFTENNGINGDSPFIILSQPSDLTGLTNGANGTFTYGLSFPYWSQSNKFSMEVILEVTLIP